MLSVSPIHQHRKPICGMIKRVKRQKQQESWAGCCEQKYADLKFVPDDQTRVQFIFALLFCILAIFIS